MENLETIFYLSAIVEVITLICFFVLCSNVSSIKKRIGGTEFTRMNKFNSFILTGQTDHAKELLVQMMMCEPEWEYIFYSKDKEYMNYSREKLKEKYRNHLDVLNISLNWDALDKIHDEEQEDK